MLIYDYGLILINNNRPVMYVHPIQQVTEEQDRHACSELLRSPLDGFLCFDPALHII